MASLIWTSTLSFGLLNVPVSLLSGERSVALHSDCLLDEWRGGYRFDGCSADAVVLAHQGSGVA